MQVKVILFDLDGVIYQGDAPITGAAETLEWVGRCKIPHIYLTNTTSRPRSAIADKVDRMGIRIEPDRILTPPAAARHWLLEQGVRAVALFVPQSTKAEFAGLDLLPEGREDGAGAVLLGDLGEAWDFHTLNRAFRLLMAQPSPYLVALGMTRYWQAAEGLRLDTAPFVAALQHATGIEPIVLGKPAKPFYRTALTMLGGRPDEGLMIGDDIRGDIEGAQAIGLKTLLVRTGKFRPQDLEGHVKPDAVIDSIAELPEWWQDNLPR
jgi:phospholysine phosphohistidine inorganic pyrophosphate phosphatase